MPLTPEQQDAHDELDRPIAQLMQTAKRRPLTQPEFLRLMSLLTRQRILCNGLAQRDFEIVWPTLERAGAPTEAIIKGLCSPKLLELRELLAQLAITQGRKVVVFSQWRRMLRLAEWATSDVLSKEGLRPLYFTGEEGQRRRTQNLVDFHDDPRAAVLFATDAGGVGLNLQRAASACVHLDLPWNPATLEQRTGRIFRMGQTSPVEIFYLTSSSGIESRISEVVGAKKALFDGLFDGQSDEVQFEHSGSFLETVRRLVEVPAIVEGAEDEAGSPDEEDVAEAGDLVDATAVVAAPVQAIAAPALELPPPGAARAALDAPDRAADPLGAQAIGRLFADVKVRRHKDGTLQLEAPKEAAETLAAVLRGMAAMLCEGRQ